MDELPERIGNYRRDQLLGRGGMGVVYRYYDEPLDRYVAIKALPAELAGDPARRGRFEQEGRLLAQLEHPNVARIHHFLEHEKQTYLVMEYVPGVTLDAVLERDRLSVHRALHLARRVADAIEAGHCSGIIHRDVKPGNVMVTPEDHVKLLDFGIARYRHLPERIASATTRIAPPPRDRQISDERLMGTPGYMSPEQVRGKPADRRSDVWAFGCVLFECLSGEAAFPGETQVRLAATLEREPEWRLLPREVPRVVRKLLEDCLAKDPSSRPPDMECVCTALDSAQDGVSTDLRRAVPHNLRRPLDSFVGRETDIKRVRELLRDHALVTLHGDGGSGKTRLAHEVGRSIVEAAIAGTVPFPDGVWFVSLASITNRALVLQQVSTTLLKGGVLDGAGSGESLDALVDALRERSILLILDNCEQLLGGCAEILATLLEGCPGLRVIVTSRLKLEVRGQYVHKVEGLQVPDEQSRGVDESEAVQLFVDRATAVRADFRLDARTRSHVAEISRRVGGIPLLIELIAARVASLHVGEIAARLPAVLDQEEQVSASIEWTIRLLDAAERKLFTRLCVFRGGWSLEAAEAVCGDGDRTTIQKEAVFDVLGRLERWSLVRYLERADRSRYLMLEVVREYGCSKLLRGQARVALARRHLDFFLKLSQQADRGLDGGDQAAWLDRLSSERHNLRTALEFARHESVDPDCSLELAVHLHRFWYMRGFLHEGRSWLKEMIDRRERRQDVLQIQAWNALGMFAGAQREFEDGFRFYEEALAIARELKDRRREAGILTNIGLLWQEQERLDESRRFHEQSLEAYHDIDDEVGVARVKLNLGVVAKWEQCHDEAARLFEEALPVFEGTDQQRVAATHQNLGELACAREDIDEAIRQLNASMRVSLRLGDLKTIVRSFLWMASAARLARDYERAATLLFIAEPLRERVDSPMFRSDTDEYTRTLNSVTEALGEEALRGARRRGCSMDLQEAVEYAIHSQFGLTAESETETIALPPDDSG